jgi:heme-degrading monooxygenase HmoA
VFARVISAEVQAAQFDAIVSMTRQQLPGVRQQPGFREFYLLASRETGRLITISLWETREAADAVEAHASRVRAAAGPALDLVTSGVQVLEVAVQGSAGPGPPLGSGGPPQWPYSIG